MTDTDLADTDRTDTEKPDDGLDRYDLEYGGLDDAPPPKRPRSRKPAPASLAEPEASTTSIPMTYKPSRFEEGWLASSLGPFFQQTLVTDVLAHVKGGKEASVYCCRAHPVTGEELLAAKVYRPRQFRNLRNDKMYREGRPILTEDGKAAKRTDTRLMRAVGKKTEFGVQVEHTSWLMYEYTTLETLYKAGAAVPRPISAGENAILMGYRGDADIAAPTLSQVRLTPEEAAPLFDEVMRNVALMLEFGFIHGDLSAYNLLYWEGEVTLIDFPQVTHSEANRSAAFILRRDVTRVCEYFAAQGVPRDAEALADELIARYVPPAQD